MHSHLLAHLYIKSYTAICGKFAFQSDTYTKYKKKISYKSYSCDLRKTSSGVYLYSGFILGADTNFQRNTTTHSDREYHISEHGFRDAYLYLQQKFQVRQLRRTTI